MKRTLLCLLLLAGCASMDPEYKRVALLHVGMTKREVLASFGPPLRTINHGALEVFSYELNDSRPSLLTPSQKSGHYIVINRGRVEAFGRE